MRFKKVEDANKKTIEAELFAYRDKINWIKQLEDDIINSSASSQEIRGTDISDITGSKALRLITHKELLEDIERVNAIKKTIEILQRSSDCKLYNVLVLYYFQRKSREYCMRNLYISSRTFYRYKGEIIKIVAHNLGFKV